MAAFAAAHLQEVEREDVALEECYVLLEAFLGSWWPTSVLRND